MELGTNWLVEVRRTGQREPFWQCLSEVPVTQYYRGEHAKSCCMGGLCLPTFSAIWSILSDDPSPFTDLWMIVDNKARNHMIVNLATALDMS